MIEQRQQQQQQKLETQQRKAARRISGVTQSTPTEAVLREAGLEELRCRMRRTAVRTYEKWKHLEEDDARRQMADVEVAQRTGKTDWRRQSSLLYEQLVEEERSHPEEAARPPPWRTECRMELCSRR